MRTLVFNGPWEMAVVDRPEATPDDSEALVEIIATGICGSDVHGYSGETDRRVVGQVMGHETVGRVRGDRPGLPDGSLVTINPLIGCGNCAACLDGETQVCAELRVVGVDPMLAGSFAETIVIPVRNVVRLSEGLPLFHGALIEPLAVGYHALMQAVPTAGDRILVLGGGPIGQAAAIAARRQGIENVLVSEPIAARRELLERLGFAVTTPESLAADRDARLGGPATVVIDAVGIRSTIADALAHSTMGARVVLVGLGATELMIEPYGISTAERRLIGSYCYSEKHFRETAEWVSEGQPELDLLIDRTVSLDEAAEAFRALAGHPESNKTLVLSRSISDAALKSEVAA